MARPPRPHPTYRLRVFGLLALLAPLVATQALAQGTQPANCATGGAEDFELGLRINSTGTYFRVTATNALTGVVDDLRYAYPGQFVDNTACNYVAHVGESAGGDPDRAELDANVPLRLTFEELNNDDEVIRTYSYTYFLCTDAALTGSFYCPRGPVLYGYPDLLLYHEQDGRMRVYPTRLANVGGNATTGDVNAAFTDAGWVLPYYDDRVCRYYSGAACNAAFRRDVPFISPQVAPTFNLTRDEDLVQPSGQSWTWRTTDGVTTLRFPQDRKLVTRGTLSTNDLTLTAVTTSQPWGGVAVAQGQFTLTGGLLEYATRGVAVYEPARATITDATLLANGYGLEVRSRGSGGAPGALVQGVTIQGGGIGVRSDYYASYEGATSCLTDCRSRFVLTRSSTGRRTLVTRGSGEGVYALNANAEIRYTDVTITGNVGIRVANALMDPFRDNTVTRNGVTLGPGYGVSVLTGGNFRLSPAFARGYNRVADNLGTEVWVFDGGQAFFGSTFDTGFNSVYDALGGRLVRYPSGPSLLARYNWWGSASGPSPPVAFLGPVDYCPHLLCDPTTDPNCTQNGCNTSLRAGGPAGGAPAARPLGTTTALRGDIIVIGDTAGEGVFLDSLAAEIGALQAALTADADGPGTDTLVASLAALHRLDLDDATGEWGETALLLAALRGRLTEPDLDAEARAAAEAALVGEALFAMDREEYAEAAGLVAIDGALAEGAGAVRQLALVEAFLLALEGRRPEASALVAGLAEEAEDPEERQELAALAAALGEEGGGAALVPGGDGLASTTSAAAETKLADVRLGVVPNPSAGAAHITLALPAPARVRLSVYDALGREVARVADGPFGAGVHALRFDGSALPPGAYVARAVVEPTDGAARTLAHRFTVLR